ncbi:MAG: hypothetical protein HY897_03570 [Deltaproteobacteria bacterium]|nr:hypothetical protein [Deltaproteobacteria bacterium]
MQIKCSKCGGVVPYSGADQFVMCPYCEAALYVHFEGNSVHYAVRPAVAHRIIPAYVQRWLHEHDYADAPRVVKVRFAYFPYWFFRTARDSRLVPAAAAVHGELADHRLSGGDLQFFRTDLCHGAEVVSPTVFVSAARERCQRDRPPEGQPERIDLVHCPFYFVNYVYGGREYRLLIDGAAGTVIAHERPPAESDDRTRRLVLVSASAFAAFFFVNLWLESWWAMVPADLIAGAAIYLLVRSQIEPGGGRGPAREGPK